ncbi:MAG: alpha/beta hydrolase [Clostridium sp.]|uniref:alpha/beta fold hydrolase n=1 Tax=Clostridium sp. TaxID=1506 RepID=UPI00290C017C|nr:alpha/beta hydrolase [Clostridium sp.]MDU5111444.1 alpha/beta hydrolase [Clostridium sp.]
MFIEVNNIKLYYEKVGSGYPIILLHGNGENLHIFDTTVNILKDFFTVYSIDSRGHGKSSPVSELHYDEMAEDIYHFIYKLELDKPILYGFSDGGITGLLLSIKYPNLLSNLIISGANINPNGLQKKLLILFKIIYKFKKTKEYKLMLEEPNITIDMLHKITTPTYITVGSKDVIRKDHTNLIHNNIRDSQLKTFDNEDHGSYIINSYKIAEYLLEILVTIHQKK